MRGVGVIVGTMLVCAAIVLPVGGAGAQGGPDPAKVGSFSQPFTEPTVSDFAGYPRTATDERLHRAASRAAAARAGPGSAQGFIDCKPAGGGLTQLPNGKNMYWDNLAGTENVEALDPVRVRSGGPQRPDPPDGRRDKKTWTDPSPGRRRRTRRRPTSTRSSPVSCSSPPRTRTTAPCSAPTATSCPTGASWPPADQVRERPRQRRLQVRLHRAARASRTRASTTRTPTSGPRPVR